MILTAYAYQLIEVGREKEGGAEVSVLEFLNNLCGLGTE
jgi:hypothetical protein